MDTVRQWLEAIQQSSPLGAIQEWLTPLIVNLHTFTSSIEPIWQLLATVVWSAIPFIESDAGVMIAIIAGVPTIPALIAAILGNWIAVMLVVIFTSKLRGWIMSHTSEKKQEKRQTKVKRAIAKYGVPGASLLGPLLVGTHLNAFFMAAAGVERRYLIIWQTIAIIVWGIIFAIISDLLVKSIRG